MSKVRSSNVGLRITPDEKEYIKSLKPGFNIQKEEDNEMIIASKRSDFSRSWGIRLFKAAIVLNIAVIVIYIITMFFVLIEPMPDFYASTPSGNVYGPLPKYNP